MARMIRRRGGQEDCVGGAAGVLGSLLVSESGLTFLISIGERSRFILPAPGSSLLEPMKIRPLLSEPEPVLKQISLICFLTF